MIYILFPTKSPGLADDIGNALSGLGDMPAWLLVFVFCIMAAGITEFIGNIAVATIMLPIVVKLVRIVIY